MNKAIVLPKLVVKSSGGNPDAEVYGTCNPVHLYEKIKRIGGKKRGAFLNLQRQLLLSVIIQS